MDVRFQCPHCGVTIEADAALGGGNAYCPGCAEPVLVPAPGLEPGTTLGGFRLEHKLGSGAMGQVFLATQLSMGRQVALKILPHSMTANAEYVNRFQHEVRLLARLDHPNIVRAFEAGTESGFHYLAMTYVSGRTLEELLAEQGPFAEEDAIAIAIEVARALDYAWEHHHILHRDIKPANLMLDDQGSILIMDMGISKCVAEQGSMTMTGMVVGTPYFMSHEQATGDRSLDCRADIYSLGVTLYQLTTGNLPFTGGNAMEVLSKMMLEEPPPLRQLNPNLSEGFAAIVMRMMARDRTERHGSWAELVDELRDLAAGRSTHPGTRQFAVAAGARSRRRWLVPLAAGIGAVLATVAILVALARSNPPAAEAATPPQTARSVLPPAAPVAPPHPAPEPPATPVADLDVAGLAGMYDYALTFALTNPGQTDEAIRKFRAVQQAAAGTAYASQASAMIAALEARRADAPATVAETVAATPVTPPDSTPPADTAGPADLDALRRGVFGLVMDGKLTEALARIDAARASLGPDREHERNRLDRLAEHLRRRAEGLPPEPYGPRTDAPSPRSERQPDPVEQVAVALLRHDLAAARELLANTPDTATPDQRQALDTAASLVDTLTHLPQRLQAAYAATTGTKRTFQLVDGSRTLLVQQVNATGISGKEEIVSKHGTAAFKRTIAFADLTLADRLDTLALAGLAPEVLALTRGLLARQENAPSLAAEHFARATSPLGAMLRQLSSFNPAALSSDQARQLREFLTAASLPAAETDPAAIARWLASMPYSSDRIDWLRRAVEPLAGDRRQTALAFHYQPVIDTLARLQPWDSRRLDAALARLAKDNSGFDAAKRAEVRTTDTSLVIMVKGSPQLVNLTALRGLPITHLRLDGSGTRDLAPLVGMPLNMLAINGTAVTDLTPLAGMPLERLELQKTPVRDLSPLLRCPHLNTLILPAEARQLAPLRQLPRLTRIGYSWEELKQPPEVFWQQHGGK